MKVHIHDRRTDKEYTVNYNTTRVPVLRCEQCGKCLIDGSNRCHCSTVIDTKEYLLSLPDNGALISCGLEVGRKEDEVTPSQLNYLIKTGQATEVPSSQKGHGGCQSSCILRGHDRCSW